MSGPQTDEQITATAFMSIRLAVESGWEPPYMRSSYASWVKSHDIGAVSGARMNQILGRVNLGWKDLLEQSGLSADGVVANRKPRRDRITPRRATTAMTGFIKWCDRKSLPTNSETYRSWRVGPRPENRPPTLESVEKALGIYSWNDLIRFIRDQM